MNAFSAADRWLFPPAAARRLAGARILLCLILALRLSREIYLELADQPAALFRPRSFMTLFHSMPGRPLVLAIQIAGVAAALVAACGWWSRVSLPAAWVAGIFLNGMHNSLGKIMHNDVLLLLAMVPLLIAPVADEWRLFRSRTLSHPDSPRYGAPLRAASVVVVVAYFFAGYWKVRYSGLEWVTSDNMKWILLASSAEQSTANPIAHFIAGHAPLYHSIAAMSLGLELSFPAVLVWSRAAFLYVPAAILMHLGITATMGLDYWAWVGTIVAVFVNWDALARWREERRRSRFASKPAAVLLYDDDCGFCRWSMARITQWDRLGLLRAQRIQDPRSEAALYGMSNEQRLGSWHVVVGDAVYSGGAGAAPLFERLAFGRPLAAFARKFPRFTDRIYAFIADRRDQFGVMLGEDACAVDPTARDKEKPFVGG